MKFFVSSRGAGKTTRLIEQSRAPAPGPKAILTFNRAEADRLKGLLAEAKIKDVDVITFDDIESDRFRGLYPKYKRVFIDNAEKLIRRSLGRIMDPMDEGEISVAANGFLDGEK